MRELITALLSDLLQTTTAVPGASATLAVGAVQHVLNKRMEAARDIFLEELRKGGTSLRDLPEEDIASVVYRYGRAAMEGAARDNLRLLAAVAAGQAQSEGLFADEFLRWADMLATLRREELLVLGAFVRVAKAIEPTSGSRDDINAAAVAVWGAVTTELALQHEFAEEKTRQVCSAITRTGLIAVRAGTLDDGVIYCHTELLLRLHRYADIEGVASRKAASL